jgi:hypothetical protein
MNDRAELFADALTGPIDYGARFSDDRVYRYRLWRLWDKSKPKVVFVMLNPSTADEVKNDPTVERCHRRVLAMKSEYGGVEVVNIFALRSTDPRALYEHKMPIGEMTAIQTSSGGTYEQANDAFIRVALINAGMVVCGWGNHGAHLGRGLRVRSILQAESKVRGFKLMCLKMTKAGQPQHPLYVGYKTQPIPLPEEV